MRRGDAVQLGCHTLLCGDAREIEPPCATPVAVVFDPPYDDRQLSALRFQCVDALVFTDERRLLSYTDGWPRFRCSMVWDRRSSGYVSGAPLMRARFCLWFGESRYRMHGAHYGRHDDPERTITTAGRFGTFTYRPCGGGKHLATVYEAPLAAGRQRHEKPIDWLRLLLGNCTRDLIFDPFAGSGAALIACEQLGRESLHVEIDPERCDQIVERWERYQEAQRAAAG